MAAPSGEPAPSEALRAIEHSPDAEGKHCPCGRQHNQWDSECYGCGKEVASLDGARFLVRSEFGTEWVTKCRRCTDDPDWQERRAAERWARVQAEQERRWAAEEAAVQAARDNPCDETLLVLPYAELCRLAQERNVVISTLTGSALRDRQLLIDAILGRSVEAVEEEPPDPLDAWDMTATHTYRATAVDLGIPDAETLDWDFLIQALIERGVEP